MKPSHRVPALAALALLLIAGRPVQTHAQSDNAPNDTASRRAADKSAELDARVKVLEDRYEQSSGFRDSDYILRIQKQYETYYEKAFNTQVAIVGIVGLIFTLILAIAGRFSFRMFESRIEYATSKATGELKVAFEQRLTSELAELQKENRDHTAKAIEDLTAKTDKGINRIDQRVRFDFQVSQGLTFANAGRHADARRHYNNAIDSYLTDKSADISEHDCAIVIANGFRSLYSENDAQFEEAARRELREARYKTLQAELKLAGNNFKKLGELFPEEGQT